MQKLLWVLGALLVASAGCRQPGPMSAVKGTDAEQYALVVKSVDQYAEKQGLSREEAIRELRQKANASAQDAPYRSLAEQGRWDDRGYPVQPAAAYHVDPGPPSPSTLSE